jgi:hypothetical protein
MDVYGSLVARLSLGKTKVIKTKPYPGVNQSTKNPKRIGLGSNMRLHVDRPATNHLAYGATHTHVTRDSKMYFISGKM